MKGKQRFPTMLLSQIKGLLQVLKQKSKQIATQRTPSITSGPPISICFLKSSINIPNRRLLGREFPDTSLQQEIGLLPYKVVEKDSRPFLQVQINGTEKLYSPEEITAEILKRMKTAAEHWTSNRVTNAVISIPAYFNDAQRQATKDASAIAGLNVLRLIDEPRAAGLAYELDKIRDDEYCYLVYNIEERSCDLTITSVDHGVFELLGNQTGDFGTRDFDQDLFRYFLNLAHAGVAQFDISEDFEGIDRLNLEVKQAQETLLTFPSANINASLHNGEKILSTVVTREKVQELHAEGSVYKVIALVEKVLFDAKLEKREIDGLIVTGDPVYAAKIQAILQGYFEGAKLYSDLNSDEIVVRGVARMAGIFSGEYMDGWDMYSPVDVLPLSVGIETAGGLYTKFILRNTMVPTRKTRLFLPAGDSQEKVVLRIYEGERELVKYNRYLGTLELDGLSRMQRGGVEIEVAFVVTPEFELIVTAKEKGSDYEAEVVFDDRTLRHRRWQEDLNNIVREAEETYESDLQEKEKAIAENSWKQDNFGVVIVV
jgi:heat shock protein 5